MHACMYVGLISAYIVVIPHTTHAYKQVQKELLKNNCLIQFHCHHNIWANLLWRQKHLSVCLSVCLSLCLLKSKKTRLKKSSNYWGKERKIGTRHTQFQGSPTSVAGWIHHQVFRWVPPKDPGDRKRHLAGIVEIVPKVTLDYREDIFCPPPPTPHS